MRISDWSSDVCSSDLQAARLTINRQIIGRELLDRRPGMRHGIGGAARTFIGHGGKAGPATQQAEEHQLCIRRDIGQRTPGEGNVSATLRQQPVEQEHARSEEQTSELQSHKRTSYAVLCWEKIKTTSNNH